jgi:hypothetical protein
MEPGNNTVSSDLKALSLATLVTRPGFSLYSTTTRQIEDRRSSIDLTASRHVRALIDDWHMISLHRHDIDEVRIHLVGQVRGTRRIRITTPLREIDLTADLVITQNSIYALGSQAPGEPSHRHLLAIIHVFHVWGLGMALGMPRIFGGSDE